MNIEYNQTSFDSLVIYDYLGAEIISANLDKSGTEIINIQHLATGTYQVAFVGKDKVVSKSLMIVK